jgi:hypothetical protein
MAVNSLGEFAQGDANTVRQRAVAGANDLRTEEDGNLHVGAFPTRSHPARSPRERLDSPTGRR